MCKVHASILHIQFNHYDRILGILRLVVMDANGCFGMISRYSDQLHSADVQIFCDAKLFHIHETKRCPHLSSCPSRCNRNDLSVVSPSRVLSFRLSYVYSYRLIYFCFELLWKQAFLHNGSHCNFSRAVFGKSE